MYYYRTLTPEQKNEVVAHRQVSRAVVFQMERRRPAPRATGLAITAFTARPNRIAISGRP
jgi:hypothetical protein